MAAKGFYRVQRENELWHTLDCIFLEHVSTAVTANAFGRSFNANESHPWGKGPVHFEPKYYTYLSKELSVL